MVAFELCAGNSFECSELSRLFCGSLGDKILGTMQAADVWLVKFQGEAKILSGLFM